MRRELAFTLHYKHPGVHSSFYMLHVFLSLFVGAVIQGNDDVGGTL